MLTLSEFTSICCISNAVKLDFYQIGYLGQANILTHRIQYQLSIIVYSCTSKQCHLSISNVNQYNFDNWKMVLFSKFRLAPFLWCIRDYKNMTNGGPMSTQLSHSTPFSVFKQVSHVFVNLCETLLSTVLLLKLNIVCYQNYSLNFTTKPKTHKTCKL